MTPDDKLKKNVESMCPVHERLNADIERLNQLMWGLPCERQETRLDKLESEMKEQRKLMDEVRQTLWLWKGSLALAAFLGSVVGASIISLLMTFSRR